MRDRLHSVLGLVYKLCWGHVPIMTAHELWLYSYYKVLYLLCENGIQISLVAQDSSQTKFHFLFFLKVSMMILGSHLIKWSLWHCLSHHDLLLTRFLFRRHIELVLQLKIWWYCGAKCQSKTIQLMQSWYGHCDVLNSV